MRFVSVIAVGLLLATGASAENWKRITTEEEYRATLVGKKTCNKSGCATAMKNGKMRGKFGDQTFKGAWKWSGKYLCRAGKLGGTDLGTDCQVIEVSGKKVRITRNQGKGDQVIYSW